MPKLKKTHRHRPQIPLLLSTDIAGIMAFKTAHYYQLINTISADCGHIDGVEFLPFRFNHRRVQKMLCQSKIPIIGVHGPLAWNTPDKNSFEKIYASLFSHVMPSLKTALNIVEHTQPQYLLFHEPDFGQCHFNRQLAAYLKKESTPIIMLENVYRPNSLQISVNQANKLITQTQAGIMIDLVHLLMEVMAVFSSSQNYHRQLNQANISQYWTKMIEAMDQALQQVPMAGLHIPIGTNHDSLPWDLLTATHWQQLAQLLDQHQERLIALTLENQHSETILSLTNKHLPAIIKDKKKKIRTLIRHRVL